MDDTLHLYAPSINLRFRRSCSNYLIFLEYILPIIFNDNLANLTHKIQFQHDKALPHYDLFMYVWASISSIVGLDMMDLFSNSIKETPGRINRYPAFNIFHWCHVSIASVGETSSICCIIMYSSNNPFMIVIMFNKYFPLFTILCFFDLSPSGTPLHWRFWLWFLMHFFFYLP